MKVLIVEDELLESAALAHILRTYYSETFYQILSAQDGESAVEIARQELPELVLMDINLPVLNGIEAAKCICTACPDCKIIMISAYSDYAHLRESMRNRALDYIVKPYSVETLREAIGRVLSKSEKLEVYGKMAVVEKVKSYINTHYAENISLQDVASEASLDKSYLGRLFRDECGVTVMGYLKQIRLYHAKEQLLQGRTAAEVALLTGFGDPAYFSRYFKQEVGCSPTQYRRSNK